MFLKIFILDDSNFLNVWWCQSYPPPAINEALLSLRATLDYYDGQGTSELGTPYKPPEPSREQVTKFEEPEFVWTSSDECKKLILTKQPLILYIFILFSIF